MIPDPSFGFFPPVGSLDEWRSFDIWVETHDYRYGRSLTFFPLDSILSDEIEVHGLHLDYRFSCFYH